MIIFPAIDLKNGEAVRLTQGDYNQIKVYFKNYDYLKGVLV